MATASMRVLTRSLAQVFSRFEATETLVLFGYSDRACQEKLNLYREETA